MPKGEQSMAKQGREKCQIAGSKLLGCLWLLLVAEWLPTLRRRGMGSREAQVEQRHCLRVNELCKQFLITCLFGSHSISYFPGRVEWGSAGQALRQGVRGVGGRGYHSKQQAANRRAALEQQSSTVAQQPIEADFKLNWINRSPRTRSAGNEVLPRPPDHVTVGHGIEKRTKEIDSFVFRSESYRMHSDRSGYEMLIELDFHSICGSQSSDETVRQTRDIYII